MISKEIHIKSFLKTNDFYCNLLLDILLEYNHLGNEFLENQLIYQFHKSKFGSLSTARLKSVINRIIKNFSFELNNNIEVGFDGSGVLNGVQRITIKNDGNIEVILYLDFKILLINILKNRGNENS